MSTYKCDRCGKYFDTHPENSDYFDSFDDVLMIVHKKDRDMIKDLCEECFSQFVNWWKYEEQVRNISDS